MRCGGQRACNPSSSQRQFEHRFGANAALADRPGISAPGAELARALVETGRVSKVHPPSVLFVSGRRSVAFETKAFDCGALWAPSSVSCFPMREASRRQA
jgi:hypothetical protein